MQTEFGDDRRERGASVYTAGNIGCDTGCALR